MTAMSIILLIFALICGGAAVAYGVWASRAVLASSAGNERMQEVAHAIQEVLRPT